MKKELLRISDGEIWTVAGKSVRNINLLLREGECVSFVGNETSGRGQLAKFFAGENELQYGTIYVRGSALQAYSRQAMEEAKIYYINSQQPFMNCLNLAENFFLMRHSRMKKTVLNKYAIELRTQQVLEEYGLKYESDCDTKLLSHMDCLLLNIVKAADQGACILVLHEVTCGLMLPQIRQLVGLLRKLKQRGIGILISDNWGNWFEEIADCLVLLQEGQIVRKLYTLDDFTQQETLLNYESIDLSASQKSRERMNLNKQHMTLLLEYHGIEVSIECGEGECVLLHSFDSQVLEGCWESLTSINSRCKLLFPNEAIPFTGPSKMLHKRIAFWDCNKPSTLINENLTPEENILLPSMPRISSHGMWKKNGQRILADESFWGRNMLSNARQPFTSELTILCSRWKLFHPRVLLMHNAFSATDKEGRTELMRFVKELCERSTIVVLLEAADEFLHGFADKEVSL